MKTRYGRQIVLPEIGDSGQERLAKARVLVVGAGGLGSPALLYLTAAGVGLHSHGGCIGIIDHDTVDTSNLQRQIVFNEHDVGQPKTLAALAHLRALNNQTGLISHTERLDASNILDIMGRYDLVIDGSDNFSTKYLINDAAAKLNMPVVYGSILGFEGQASVFWASQGPCYRCIYPQPAQSHIPNCAEAGTLGGIAGLIGTIQAVEACKLALGLDHCQKFGIAPLIGQLLIFDGLGWDIRKLDLTKSDSCPTCSANPDDIPLFDDAPALCASDARSPLRLKDLNDIHESGIPITLIDVRDDSEWRAGHLDGAIHIPLSRLLSDATSYDLVEPRSLVIVYCHRGIRSARAVKHLSAKGFDAHNLLVDWPS